MKTIITLLTLLITTGLFNVSYAAAGTITGKVTDKTTGEPLPGVNIILEDTNIGASTDSNGEFIISNVPAGRYSVRASFIGYETRVITDVMVSGSRPAFLEFELMESVIRLEGVTVESGYFDKDPLEVNSVKSFSYEEIRRAPGGFEDVIRALSVLPGVARQDAGRNDLVVRGGAPSENLYLIDGFVVPNINHFGGQGVTGGSLSYVNLDFVGGTTFSSGGFPALYGDKLSSVLRIDLRDGRTDRLGGKATVSATQFGLNLEGPVGEKGNFIFSARRSYLDFIFNAAGFNFIPEYYDLLGKVNFNLGNNTELSYLYIGAFDNVKFNNDNEEDRYDNSRILGSNQVQYLTGLSLKKLFGNGFYTVSLSRNYIDYETFQRDINLEPIFLNNSTEAENELKANVVYKTGKSSEINAGISGKIIKFEGDILFPENFVTTFGEVLPVNEISKNEYYFKSAAFLQYSTLFFERLRTNIGARVNYFDEINNSYSFSPRFSAAYKLNELNTLSFSTGIYHQSPSYIWLSAYERNKDLDYVKVYQYITGWEHLLRKDLRLKIEGFYKDYADYPSSLLRPYLVLANTGAGHGGADNNFQSFGLEPLVSSGKGRVHGAELSLQKKSTASPLYGLLSLTYSESWFTALDGVERPGTYDQKWILNLSGGYRIGENWEIAMKFRFATGNPYTPYNADGTQNVSEYLALRFEPLHSLDVRVDRRWDLGSYYLIAYIDIQNIYNNKNTNSIRFNYREGKVDDESSIGLLPSIGISLEF